LARWAKEERGKIVSIFGRGVLLDFGKERQLRKEQRPRCKALKKRNRGGVPQGVLYYLVQRCEREGGLDKGTEGLKG